MKSPANTNNGAGAVVQDRLVRPLWMVGGPECDWPEDQPYENGNYYNKCQTCQSDFIGHKRRCWCRKCHLNATGFMVPIRRKCEHCTEGYVQDAGFVECNHCNSPHNKERAN